MNNMQDYKMVDASQLTGFPRVNSKGNIKNTYINKIKKLLKERKYSESNNRYYNVIYKLTSWILVIYKW